MAPPSAICEFTSSSSCSCRRRRLPKSATPLGFRSGDQTLSQWARAHLTCHNIGAHRRGAEGSLYTRRGALTRLSEAAAEEVLMHAPCTHLDPPAAYRFSTMISTASPVRLGSQTPAMPRLDDEQATRRRSGLRGDAVACNGACAPRPLGGWQRCVFSAVRKLKAEDGSRCNSLEP